jgi:hypothetical protein
MRRLTPLLLVLTLAGCGEKTATATYDAKQALLTADRVALVYLSQPPCPPGQTSVTCVDPAAKARIKAASATVTALRHAADDAVKAGRTPDSASLTAAIVEFASVVAPFQSLVK